MTKIIISTPHTEPGEVPALPQARIDSVPGAWMTADNYAEAIGWLVICWGAQLGIAVVNEDGTPIHHNIGPSCNCPACKEAQ